MAHKITEGKFSGFKLQVDMNVSAKTSTTFENVHGEMHFSGEGIAFPITFRAGRIKGSEGQFNPKLIPSTWFCTVPSQGIGHFDVSGDAHVVPWSLINRGIAECFAHYGMKDDLFVPDPSKAKAKRNDALQEQLIAAGLASVDAAAAASEVPELGDAMADEAAA
jgi:hypothetical protein